MNTFQNRSFLTIRENRFKNPTFRSEHIQGFDFNNNLKSDNIPNLLFTNYTKSSNTKKYQTLKSICEKINNNFNELDKLFEADEIDIKVDIPKLNRIYQIINIVNKENFSRNELVLKFKNKADKEIQFYIKSDNSVFKLYLVDLYHLGIEATNVKTGRADMRGIYKAKEGFKYNINNIGIT